MDSSIIVLPIIRLNAPIVWLIAHKMFTRKRCKCVMRAIVNSSLVFVKKAIHYGCNYDPQDAIHMAAFHGNICILQYLNESPTGCVITENVALAAASSGNIQCIMYVLKNYGSVPNNFISVLVTNGYLECLKLMVTRHRVVFNRKNLCQAAFFGHYECLKYIILNSHKSIDVNINTLQLTVRGRAGISALTVIDNFLFLNAKVLSYIRTLDRDIKEFDKCMVFCLDKLLLYK